MLGVEGVPARVHEVVGDGLRELAHLLVHHGTHVVRVHVVWRHGDGRVQQCQRLVVLALPVEEDRQVDVGGVQLLAIRGGRDHLPVQGRGLLVDAQVHPALVQAHGDERCLHLRRHGPSQHVLHRLVDGLAAAAGAQRMLQQVLAAHQQVVGIGRERAVQPLVHVGSVVGRHAVAHQHGQRRGLGPQGLGRVELAHRLVAPCQEVELGAHPGVEAAAPEHVELRARMLGRGHMGGVRAGRLLQPRLQGCVEPRRCDVECLEGLVDLVVARLAGREPLLQVGQFAVDVLPLAREQAAGRRGEVGERARVVLDPAACRDFTGQGFVAAARMRGGPALAERALVFLEAGRRCQEQMAAIFGGDRDALPVHAGRPHAEADHVPRERGGRVGIEPRDHPLRAQRRRAVERDVEPAERGRGRQCESRECRHRAALRGQAQAQRAGGQQRGAHHGGQQQRQRAFEAHVRDQVPEGAGA